MRLYTAPLFLFWFVSFSILAAIAFIYNHAPRRSWVAAREPDVPFHSLRQADIQNTARTLLISAVDGASPRIASATRAAYLNQATGPFLDFDGNNWPDWVHTPPPDPENLTFAKILVSPWVPCALSKDHVIPAVLTISDKKRDREMMRHAYEQLSQGRVRPVFPVGRKHGRLLDEDEDDFHPDVALLKEAAQYGDLIIADFPDSYFSLPFKTLSILQWFVTEKRCATMPFVMKVDADVLVNWPNLERSMSNFWDRGYQFKNGTILDPRTQPFWTGHRWDNMGVIHDVRHRNYEPDLDDKDAFPPYTSGPAQIFNHQLASKVIELRPSIHIHFRNEDAMIGLILEGNTQPIGRDEFIVFSTSSWRRSACQRVTLSITDCPCLNWWTYHTNHQDWINGYNHVKDNCIAEVAEAKRKDAEAMSKPADGDHTGRLQA